jgi:hypothetical protein
MNNARPNIVSNFKRLLLLGGIGKLENRRVIMVYFCLFLFALYIMALILVRVLDM